MGKSKKAVISWSSGKDSAFALMKAREMEGLTVSKAITTVSEKSGRVGMHGTGFPILQRQMQMLGLEYLAIKLPEPCTNADYEARMAAACDTLVSEGYTHVVFGDLFLEEIRAYREKMLEGTGLSPIFPLWGIDTNELADEMITSGLKAVIACVHTPKLPQVFLGRQFGRELLDQLPEGVDPCGENGEFHTIVYDYQLFKDEINIVSGETVIKEELSFMDFKINGH